MNLEPPPRQRRRRLRRVAMSAFAIVVVAILALIADRVANAVAENDMASQFTSNGFPVKPSVTIEGFPFLTQLAARDLRTVDISATSIPAGPVTITSLTAKLNGVHFNSSFSGATVDHASATMFVSFGALASAGGITGGTGVTIKPAGPSAPDTLKLTANIGGVLSDTEEATVRQTGPRQITVRLLSNGGLVGSLLGSFGSFSFTLPQGVPPSLHITGLTLDAQGLTVSAAADNATLSKLHRVPSLLPRVTDPAWMRGPAAGPCRYNGDVR